MDMKNSYWRFGAMIITSVIVMFGLMYLNTYSQDGNGNVVVDPNTREQVYDFEDLILENEQYIELVYREIA